MRHGFSYLFESKRDATLRRPTGRHQPACGGPADLTSCWKRATTTLRHARTQPGSRSTERGSRWQAGNIEEAEQEFGEAVRKRDDVEKRLSAVKQKSAAEVSSHELSIPSTIKLI